MIGWAPFLLTGVAGALVVIVALDASSGFHASAYVSGDTVATWLHNALNASVQWLSHLGVLDCLLIGASAFLLAWGWVRAAAFVRLGTIQIADLSCDDDKLAPTAAKAVLQQALGDHGLLPPSGVPSGSPSVASIADAISKAPIPQANWLGSLIGLIPWPPASTGFQISGNLRRTGPADGAPVSFAYELVCTGPRPSVHLGEAEGADPDRGDHRGQPRHLPDHRGGRAPHLPHVGPMALQGRAGHLPPGDRDRAQEAVRGSPRALHGGLRRRSGQHDRATACGQLPGARGLRREGPQAQVQRPGGGTGRVHIDPDQASQHLRGRVQGERADERAGQ